MHFYRCTDFADAAAYATAESFFADLTRIYRDEIAALAGAGCRYIQLDEVALALLCDPAIRAKVESAGEEPDRLVDLYIESLNEAVSGAPPDVTFGVHMCRGNFKGHYLGAGGYESVAERFFGRARVNHFLLEYDTARAGDFRPLRFVKDKGVVLGLISSKTPALESSPISRAAPRKRPGTSISTGSPSARNADLPRRSPATRSPKRMSVPSSSSSSMPPRKSGTDRRPVARGRGPAGRSAAYTASAPR